MKGAPPLADFSDQELVDRMLAGKVDPCDLVTRFSGGVLGPMAAEAFQGHLRDCAGCQANLQLDALAAEARLG